MELYYKEALFNSNLHDDELHLHGDGEYSILDLEPPTAAAAFNEYSSDDPPSWFAPESTDPPSPHHHQLCSLPPTIGTEALSSFRSSGGESEAAASQGSSSTQADRSSRTRNLEDYDQHSSTTTTSFLPPTISARGGGGGFQIFFDDSSSEERKKPRLLTKKDHRESMSYSNIDFKGYTNYEPDMEAMAKMKEMIYLAAALRPLSYHNLQMEDAAAAKTKKPKRRNVRVSSDPQTVAARQRRERISDRLRVLQRLVPGGSKMDTASMLDEAANYLSFLKSRVTALETLASAPHPPFPTLLMQHHDHHHLHSFPPPHQNPNPRPPSSHTIDHLHQGRP